MLVFSVKSEMATTPTKTIFLLKARPDSLTAAESWLKSKGWIVHSTDQVKEAISRVIELKPDHVVICMDHVNPHVRILPKLFEQAFQIKVIGYMETTTATSLATTAGMDYVLYPPVAGSAVERMAAKVVRDERRAKALQTKRFVLDNGLVEIKSKAEQAQSTLLQMISSEPAYEDDAATAVRDIFASQASGETRTQILYSHTNGAYSDNTSIVRGTHRAIYDVALILPGASVIPLNECQEAICFFVDSRDHKGFVLCSMAENSSPLQTFVELFKTRFTEIMAESSETCTMSEAVVVCLPKVPFDGWVRRQAAFSKKFIHLDQECGLAYFEMAKPQVETVSVPNHQSMVSVSLLDIDSDKPLLFDVFVHLPANNKFILYNRRGNKLPALQKTRLLSRGVLDLHMRSKEIDLLHRYHLEAYLNEKISEHINALSYDLASGS